MRDSIVHTYAFNLGYAKALVKDIHQDQHFLQPSNMPNHPLWVIGHLSSTAVFVASQLGQSVEAPANLRELFGPTSRPGPQTADTPTLAAMMTLLETAHQRVAEGFLQASDDLLNDEPAIERLRTRFPTNGRFFTFAMTSHEALHLGQLSAWRRAAGLGSAL